MPRPILCASFVILCTPLYIYRALCRERYVFKFKAHKASDRKHIIIIIIAAATAAAAAPTATAAAAGTHIQPTSTPPPPRPPPLTTNVHKVRPKTSTVHVRASPHDLSASAALFRRICVCSCYLCLCVSVCVPGGFCLRKCA